MSTRAVLASAWPLPAWYGLLTSGGESRKQIYVLLIPLRRTPGELNYYSSAAAAAAKLLQLCPTLCDPIDGSPPDSPVPGILQARILEWVAISFSNTWKWKVKVKSLSRVQLLATHGLQPTRLLRPWDFPGKSTGVGCHCLLLYYLTKMRMMMLMYFFQRGCNLLMFFVNNNNNKKLIGLYYHTFLYHCQIFNITSVIFSGYFKENKSKVHSICYEEWWVF